MPDPTAELAAAIGIRPSYTDVTGTTREMGEETRRALLAALGQPVDGPEEAAERLAALRDAEVRRKLAPWYVVTRGRRPDLPLPDDAAWTLHYEDGSEREGRGPLPALPLGIHALETGVERTWLLSAPPRLKLPPRGWGLMVPLWGLKGTAAGGLGDYADLADLARAIAPSGAGFIGLNPIHARFPTDPTATSPYQPSHRRRLDILHIAAGQPASTGALVDYSAEIPAKMAALRAEYDAFTGDPAFEAWRAAEGAPLERFALHQALSERHGAYWSDWPVALQDADGPAVAEAHAGLSDGVRFHAWAQWRAETALAEAQSVARAAGMAHGLYLDLAVGTHPAGAETWEDRQSFAPGVSLGAPPDAFGPQGQTWNLAPLSPAALVSDGFKALAETLRRQLRFAGILRVDHILGFDRAFWVPDGGLPGGYVTMPREAMLAVARIEAARADAVIVGEDLGVVPEGLRARLEVTGILGCTLAMFERRENPFRYTRPGRYQTPKMASFSTHDLPTWDGWRSGTDLGEWARIGALSDEDHSAARERRRSEIAAFDRALGVSEPTVDDLHGFLAATRSRLVAVQAENLLGETGQPNLPGTVETHPNWRRRLSLGPDDLARHPALAHAAAKMAAKGRNGG
ncbi:4-alpha-glucanotransferase [Rhodobacterales bacterium HKCCE3408]|nr:4-alpha-glucanotransferase [Rhodobacterales bacterium HKCCE3408]